MRKKEIIKKLQAENVATLEYVFELEAKYKNLMLYADNVEARVETLEAAVGGLIDLINKEA